MQSHVVKPKKHLGQHFLTDEQIAKNIADALLQACKTKVVMEIGPGTGVLTKYLINKPFRLIALDVDLESVVYLHKTFGQEDASILQADFLQADFGQLTSDDFSVIGNFPYNISSQIVFKIIEHKYQIPLMVGMFQKEVAERICAQPGSKAYGILSVLTQAFYETTYLFTVNEDVFDPPPKVKSGVMRMERKALALEVDEKLFFKIVKTAFNQRRKKMRNAISVFGIEDAILQKDGFADKRAEQLSVADFIMLTKLVIQHGK